MPSLCRRRTATGCYSDDTENLERFVQLFGRPAERRIEEGPARNYYLEFGYSADAFAPDLAQKLTVETIERGGVEFISYLVSLDRLEPAKL